MGADIKGPYGITEVCKVSNNLSSSTTGNSLVVTPTGTTGSTAAVDFVNTANTGRCFRVYTNLAAAGTHSLALFNQANAAGTVNVVEIYKGGTGAGYGLLITHLGSAAALAVTSTTGGILFPRMTSAQKAASAAVSGSVVYDTDLGKLCVYGAGGWETITSA